MKICLGLLASGVLLLAAGCASSEPANEPAGDEAELRSGEASFVIPLIDEKKKLLSRFNAKAREHGLKETPDTFEVKNQADAEKVADLRSYFAESVQEQVGAPDQPMPAWGPDSFTNWSRSHVPGLCYKGNPLKVISVIEQSRDTVFSDQLIIQGWRYKQEKHFADGMEDFEAELPDVWAEWRGTGTAILVISSTSDDGDDLTPAVIPRCR